MIGGYFDCQNNQISSLEYFPKKIGDYVSFQNNPSLGLAQKKYDNFLEVYHVHEQYIHILKERHLLSHTINANEAANTKVFKI